MKGVLLAAVLVAAGTLITSAVMQYTPLGRRFRDGRGRSDAEREIALDCPIHGPQVDSAIVRTPTGERVCAQCFRDAVLRR